MTRPHPTFLTLSGGHRLHYRIQGKSGAPWMVMINGLLSDATMWGGVMGAFASRFRVLSFDGRGQGKSDVPEGEAYAPDTLAGDVWELMEGLGVEHPWLIGLSNGSSISLELLSRHPGAFAGAVLTSCVPRIDFTMRLRLQHWLDCLEKGGTLMQFDAAAPYLWGDRFLEARHGVLRAYHQAVVGLKRPEAIRRARLQVEGALNWDIRAHLGSLSEPILLLCGAEDLLTPPWKCLETAQFIPSSRFEVVPGIGHAYPVENPNQFIQQVGRFIDGVGKETGYHG